MPVDFKNWIKFWTPPPYKLQLHRAKRAQSPPLRRLIFADEEAQRAYRDLQEENRQRKAQVPRRTFPMMTIDDSASTSSWSSHVSCLIRGCSKQEHTQNCNVVVTQLTRDEYVPSEDNVDLVGPSNPRQDPPPNATQGDPNNAGGNRPSNPINVNAR